ncbi:hypothetical protein ABPG74_003158 [Tetrahymena malaccensis]
MDITYKLGSNQYFKFNPLDFERDQDIEWDNKMFSKMFLDSIKTDQKTNNFLQNQFTNHFLQQAFVGQCNNITELFFYFDKKILYEDDFDELGQAISQCQNLKKLSMYSWKNYFSHTTLKNLGKGISECYHLQQVEIGFQKDYFDGGSEEVCTVLSKCQAKQISLKFSDTYFEDDKIYNLIGQELSKNQQIKNLSLEFSSYLIDNQVAQSFSEELAKFRIFQLGIDLYNNNLSEEDMQLICVNIKKIKSLNTLSFKYEEKDILLQINFAQFLKRKLNRLVNFQ